MANGSKGEKAGTEAFDAKAELESEAAVGTGEAVPAGGDAPAPSPSGDSPKRQGDKMEHAVREATGTPPEGKA